MKRLLSSLFADRRNSHSGRTSANRNRKAQISVEALEGRQLLALLTSPIPASAHAQIMWQIAVGDSVKQSNEGLAISWYNAAWDEAEEYHDPEGMFHIAASWASLPGGSDDWTGWAAENDYSQAIALATYWFDPLEGPGSGADYAFGAAWWGAVIENGQSLANGVNSSGGVSPNSYADGILWLSQNNAIAWQNMIAQSVPPIAAGTWQLNVGGTNISFGLTQYVGLVTGSVYDGVNGRSGDFQANDLVDLHPQTDPGEWYGAYFQITNWNDGSGATSGFAMQDVQNSNQMCIFIYESGSQQWVYLGAANRTDGTNWVQ
jgi:hypothetical protein